MGVRIGAAATAAVLAEPAPVGAYMVTRWLPACPSDVVLPPMPAGPLVCRHFNCCRPAHSLPRLRVPAAPPGPQALEVVREQLFLRLYKELPYEIGLRCTSCLPQPDGSGAAAAPTGVPGGQLRNCLACKAWPHGWAAMQCSTLALR